MHQLGKVETRFQEKEIKKIEECPDESCLYKLIYGVTKVGEEKPKFTCDLEDIPEEFLDQSDTMSCTGSWSDYFLFNIPNLLYTRTTFGSFLVGGHMTPVVEIGKCSPF